MHILKATAEAEQCQFIDTEPVVAKLATDANIRQQQSHHHITSPSKPLHKTQSVLHLEL